VRIEVFLSRVPIVADHPGCSKGGSFAESRFFGWNGFFFRGSVAGGDLLSSRTKAHSAVATGGDSSDKSRQCEHCLLRLSQGAGAEEDRSEDAGRFGWCCQPAGSKARGPVPSGGNSGSGAAPLSSRRFWLLAAGVRWLDRLLLWRNFACALAWWVLDEFFSRFPGFIFSLGCTSVALSDTILCSI